jgi:hypothetical protein
MHDPPFGVHVLQSPATIARAFCYAIEKQQLTFTPSICNPLGTMAGFWFSLDEEDDDGQSVHEMHW